jgi:hypothetical protein
MKIGMITDSPSAPSFNELLGAAAELGVEQLGSPPVNCRSAPHLTFPCRASA